MPKLFLSGKVTLLCNARIPHSLLSAVSQGKGARKARHNRLSRMLEGLVRKLNTEEGYPGYIEDSARVIEGLQTVVSGVLAEEIVEDLAEIAEENP